MASTCAGCMRPIDNGDDFVLAGTECFHKRCTGLISESYATRMKMSLLRMRAEGERLERRVLELERIAADHERRLKAHEKALAQLEKAAKTDRTQIDQLREINADARRRAEEFRSERDRAQDELGAVMRQLAVVQNENETLRRQVSGSGTADDQESDKDPTVARFRLLELD